MKLVSFTSNGYMKVAIIVPIVDFFDRNIKLTISIETLIIKIISEGLSLRKNSKIIARPPVPPVTKLRGLNIKLKFNDATKSINKR